VAGVRGHAHDGSLVAVETDVVRALVLPPEQRLELLGQRRRFVPQAGGRVALLPDLVEDVRPGALGGHDVGLMFAECDRERRQVPVGVDDAVAGVLPALVVVAGRAGSRLVLLQPVAVDVAVGVDPRQRPLDVRTDVLEGPSVGVPAPGHGRGPDERRRRLVGAVIGRVGNQLEVGQLPVAYLVLDLAGLHVPGVVVTVGLKVGEGMQAAEGESRRQRKGLHRDRERVAAEDRNEPWHPGGRHPRVDVRGPRVIVDVAGPRQVVVHVHAQAGQVVDRLPDDVGHGRIARGDARRVLDPSAPLLHVLVVDAEEVAAHRGRRAGRLVIDQWHPQDARVPSLLGFEVEVEQDSSVGELRRRPILFDPEL
jgi:hypothetical protein